MKKKPRTWFKQCNHRSNELVGRVAYDNDLGPRLWWCGNCGALGSAYFGSVISWRYPKRARNR